MCSKFWVHYSVFKQAETTHKNWSVTIRITISAGFFLDTYFTCKKFLSQVNQSRDVVFLSFYVTKFLILFNPFVTVFFERTLPEQALSSFRPDWLPNHLRIQDFVT